MSQSRKSGMFSATRVSSGLIFTRNTPPGDLALLTPIDESSQRAPNQWPFLPPVRRQIEFKKGVVSVVIAKEESGIGDRNDVRSVIYFSPVHLTERDGG